MRSKEGRILLNIGKEVERFSLDTINEDLLYEDICKYDDHYREVHIYSGSNLIEAVENFLTEIEGNLIERMYGREKIETIRGIKGCPVYPIVGKVDEEDITIMLANALAKLVDPKIREYYDVTESLYSTNNKEIKKIHESIDDEIEELETDEEKDAYRISAEKEIKLQKYLEDKNNENHEYYKELEYKCDDEKDEENEKYDKHQEYLEALNQQILRTQEKQRKYHEDFDEEGYNKITGSVWDEEGYDREGYDNLGYDRDGYDEDGYDRKGYDIEGYDRNGYDENGNTYEDNNPDIELEDCRCYDIILERSEENEKESRRRYQEYLKELEEKNKKLEENNTEAANLESDIDKELEKKNDKNKGNN